MSVKVIMSENIVGECCIEGFSTVEKMESISVNITLCNVPLKLSIYHEKSNYASYFGYWWTVAIEDHPEIRDWMFLYTIMNGNRKEKMTKVDNRRSRLEDHKLQINEVLDDKITVQISVAKFEAFPCVKYVPKTRINHTLKRLKDTQLMVDFELIVHDKDGVEVRFKVHKCILAAHSPVFAAMLTSGMEEQTLGVMVISEFSAEVVREVVHFMYAEVHPLEGVNISMGRDMLRFACMYQMNDLEDYCVDRVTTSMTKATAVETLCFADHLGCSSLKKTSIGFIKEQFDRVECLMLLDDLSSVLRNEVINSLRIKLW